MTTAEYICVLLCVLLYLGVVYAMTPPSWKCWRWQVWSRCYGAYRLFKQWVDRMALEAELQQRYERTLRWTRRRQRAAGTACGGAGNGVADGNATAPHGSIP